MTAPSKIRELMTKYKKQQEIIEGRVFDIALNSHISLGDLYQCSPYQINAIMLKLNKIIESRNGIKGQEYL